MTRELAVVPHVLFPTADPATLPAAECPIKRLDKPGLVLLVGSVVTAILVALDLSNAGRAAAVFESLYPPVAAAATAIALLMLSTRPEPALPRYRLLAWSIGGSGLGMLFMSLSPLIGVSLAVGLANTLFVSGGSVAMVIIVPVLYRNLDRRAIIGAGLDGGILLFAGMTLVLTMWRSGRIPNSSLADLAVPILAAGVFASSGIAVIAALTKRAAPALRGVWMGVAGVSVVGVSWVLWFDMVMHDQVRSTATGTLYATGILVLGYAWMTWNDDVGGGRTYERVARTMVDWLPIAGIVVCVAVAAIPHDSIAGIDPAPVGTALVVMLSIVRQRVLIVRERWAAHCLAGEVEERSQSMLSLARLEQAPTLDLTAMRICDEALRLDGIDTTGIYVFNPTGGTVPLALAGAHRKLDRIGHAIDPTRSEHLRTLAGAGAWIDTPGPEAKTQQGRLLGEAFAPLRWDERIIGVVSMATTHADEAKRLAGRLPTLAEFGVVSAALLGPMLANYWRIADIRSQLDSIISSHGFLPVFQPVVRLETREVLGFEALTRFRDGTRPDQRFAEAHTANMSVRLETACLREQLEAASWLPSGLWVSLNVSPALATAIVPLISTLERVDREIILEITEHVEIDDYRQLLAALELVRSKVRLAVDDAGAGYAGLRHILELRPHFVKLDISLVRHVNADPARQAMVAGMAHFARNSGCDLIAEGIETEEELNELIRLGIKLGQGYLFGKPGPITLN